jgi:hypothetical protein
MTSRIIHSGGGRCAEGVDHLQPLGRLERRIWLVSVFITMRSSSASSSMSIRAAAP